MATAERLIRDAFSIGETGIHCREGWPIFDVRAVRIGCRFRRGDYAIRATAGVVKPEFVTRSRDEIQADIDLAISEGRHSTGPILRVCQGCEKLVTSIWYRTLGSPGKELCRDCAEPGWRDKQVNQPARQGKKEEHHERT